MNFSTVKNVKNAVKCNTETCKYSEVRMEYKITARGAEIYGLSSLDLAETFDCGQCFRWEEKNGRFSAVVRCRYTTVYKEGDTLIIENCTEDELKNIFIEYFDLSLDYDAVRGGLVEKYPILRDAAEHAPGIHILSQEPWEALCSFIISQNNNIPRIKGIISRLCEAYGEKCGESYTFPTAEKLAVLEPDDLKYLRAGFRAGYIIDGARKTASGEVDLEYLKTASISEARESLMTIRGVGPKVAECTLLYGLHRLEAFPIDTWMKKAMSTLYQGLSPADLGEYAGIAQQYIFHYSRSLKIGGE